MTSHHGFASLGRCLWQTITHFGIPRTHAPSRFFLLTDALGSILSEITWSAGGASVQGNQLFGPYGKGRYSAGTINTTKGFTGQYNDPLTGLDYYVSRYYDPVVGVFLSADNVQGNLQGMDPYTYVGGNPESRNDPTGQLFIGASNNNGHYVLPPPPPPPPPQQGSCNFFCNLWNGTKAVVSNSEC